MLAVSSTFGFVRQTHRVHEKEMPENHHLKTSLSPSQPVSNPLRKSKKPRICKLQHMHGNGDFPSFPSELRHCEHLIATKPRFLHAGQFGFWLLGSPLPLQPSKGLAPETLNYEWWLCSVSKKINLFAVSCCLQRP